MCGCFQTRRVELIMKRTMPLRDGEDRTIMNVMKRIGAGARELIKIYSDTTGGGKLSKNVRQTNIMGFFGRKGRGVDMNRDNYIYRGEIVREKKKKGKKKEKNKILRKCRQERIHSFRKKWYEDVSKGIYKIKDRDLRGLMEDMWTKMKCRRGGEMAMCGTFQTRWAELIMKRMMPLRDGEDRTATNLLKSIGAGARELIKIYSDTTGGGN